jgi:sugar phosphate isomerase/epimerase
MAIQLYSFHNDIDKDLAGTLRRVKALGFDKVETYPIGGVTATQLRAALDAAGLKAVSAHMPWDRIQSDPAGVVADVRILGAEQFGPGSIGMFDGKPFRVMSLAEAQQAGEALKRACAAADAAGMRVFIHTHGNEFGPSVGTAPLDRMSEAADNCFDLEADITWVKWAGVDPAQLIQRYGKRVSSLHVKDIAARAIGQDIGKIDHKDLTVLGQGSVDWPAVMRASRAAGVRHYIIEDESPDPAGQIPHSLAYLDSIAGR